MNDRFTLPFLFLTGLLFMLFSFTAVSQQTKNTGVPQGKVEQNQLIKAMRVDSMPKTIFPSRAEITPEQKEAERLFMEGTMKGKNGEYKEAIDDFTESLSLYENGNTYFKRGYSYLFIGNYPAALADFTETLRIMPSHQEAIFGRGIARFEMNDYAGAEVDLRQYLDIIHINAVAFDYMAALCFLRKDFQCALQNYSDVIRCDSTYPDAYVNRAMIRHYLRDYKGAIADYTVAIKQTPADKKVFNNRAATKMMMQDYQSALQDLNRAIELDPKYADAFNNRGRVRQYLGDTSGACSDWQRALALGIEDTRELIMKYCK